MFKFGCCPFFAEDISISLPPQKTAGSGRCCVVCDTLAVSVAMSFSTASRPCEASSPSDPGSPEHISPVPETVDVGADAQDERTGDSKPRLFWSYLVRPSYKMLPSADIDLA
jgi:hypothetical protein